MSVLVLGAGGMLGHVLARRCAQRGETWGTVRSDPGPIVAAGVLPPDRLVGGVDASRFDGVASAIERTEPQTVLNCVGIVKQRREGGDPVPSIEINSLFPHRLAEFCQARSLRLIHVSTDCVFSGRRGSYTEDDVPDPVDLYGRSKVLGEVAGDGCLTLRTSMIGWELGTQRGLVEWFASQQGGVVPGYQRAIFSGLTTAALSVVIIELIEKHAKLDGLWHVASAPISKHELLGMLRDRLALDVAIEPEATVTVDRSLDGSRFVGATGIHIPSWENMVDELRVERVLDREGMT
jgi:dTDP-4-dehydrorhamnose reductase